MNEKPKNEDRFYITTPIYYVNDKPHIGHAYTTIAADVLARFYRALKKEVVFLTGTDENSQKTVEAAEKSGEEIKSYTDRLAGLWRSAWRTLNISNTDFIRTTEERHIKTVHEIWRRIEEAGDIYKGKYEGLYCQGHEAFVKDSDLVNGLCPDHQTKPDFISEENYFFRLSKYQDRLLEFYRDNPTFVVPEPRFNEVKSFVEQGLEDISISREAQKWGIPVPGGSGHVIYVWFDALINYASAIGLEEWSNHPADIHAIGKDILRFHAVIWPAMLFSAKLPLPKQLLVNGFFTVGGIKISKSLGNAIDPVELASKYGVDALRYFLLREIPYGEDGDFSSLKLEERYNADLANGLGNFAARVSTLAESTGELKKAEVDQNIETSVKETRTTFTEKLENFKFHEALTELWKLIQLGDLYLNETKPWEEKDAEKKTKIIYNLVVILDNVASLIFPIMPETAEKITQSITWVSNDSLRVKKIEQLFPRTDKD